MHPQRPRIGIVMGDAAGIGPEIILKTLSDEDILSRCDSLITGSYDILSLARQFTDPGCELALVSNLEEPVDIPLVPVLDCTIEQNPDFKWGVTDAINGRNCLAAIRIAAHMASRKLLDGFMMAPSHGL